MVSSKVDGRGVSRTFAHSTDRMVATTKTAPAGNRGLTETPSREVVTAMSNSSHSRKQIALEHLALAKKEFEAAAQSRLRFILLAREYGNTNAEIGAVLGVGESSIRAMIARHGGCTHCDGSNKCAACWLKQFSAEDA